MPNNIFHKRSLTPGSVPTTSSLNVGEIAMNVPDGKIFLKKSGSAGQSVETVLVSNTTTNIGALTLSGSLILSGSGTGSVLDVSAGSIDFDFDTLSFSGSAGITGSLIVTGGITGSLLGTASFATAALSSSYAVTASYVLNAVSSSFASTASFVTGSNVFGPYGSNSVVSASYAISASYAPAASPFPFTGSAIITGSLILTGSLNVSGSTTQIGDNSLLGNTLLSGSLTISGNTTITGSITAINQTASFGYVSSSFIDVTGKQTVRGYLQFYPTTDVVPITETGSYIYSSGSAGDMYFSQTNGSINNVIRLRWLEGNMYSGLLNGGIISTQSSTMYQVSSGSGLIVSLNGSLTSDPYPAVQYLNWGNLSASIALLSSSFDQSFVAIEPTGSEAKIFVQGLPYDNGQFNTMIPIGNVIHQNRSTINAVATYPSVAYGYKQRSSDFIRAFGPLKLSGLNTIVSGSTTGSLQITSGTSYNEGRNYVNDVNNPSYVTDAGQPISKIFRYYQSGSAWVYLTNGGVGFETIDPTQYSLNGVLTLVPGTGANREFTIQRVYYFPGGATKGIYVYYGNTTYTSAVDAIANIPYENFSEAPNTSAGAVLSAYLVVRNNADFTVPESYNIRPGGLFRNIGGSGGGGSAATQTLASLTDVNILTSLPTDGQPLAYDATTLKWENRTYISASLAGNASTATTASYAVTASYANVAALGGFVQGGNSFGALATLGTNDNQSLAIETNGTTKMFVSSSGNVGIGTTTPSITLDISGSITSGFDAIRFRSQYSTFGYLGTDNSRAWLSSNAAFGGSSFSVTTSEALTRSNTIRFVNGSSVESMRIDSSGNIGIGTTTPTARLHIAAPGALSTDIAFKIRNSADTADLAIINGLGNVGIGITTPSASLHVAGDVMLTSADSTGVNSLWFRRLSSNQWSLNTTNGVGEIWRVAGNSQTFYQVVTTQNGLNVTPGGNSTTYGLRITSGSYPAATLLQVGVNSLIVTGSNVGIGTTSPKSNLHVAGTTYLSGSAGTASGSSLTVYGSGSALPVFTVQGSQGELFSITDSLSGSLFSVNDISGLPILEVFSDNTILMGNYQAPSLNTTARTTTTVGNNIIYSIPTASYDGAWFEYTARSGSNARAGQIMGMWSGSLVSFTETTIREFGDTSGLVFTMIVTGSNFALTGSSATAGWAVKTIIRSI